MPAMPAILLGLLSCIIIMSCGAIPDDTRLMRMKPRISLPSRSELNTSVLMCQGHNFPHEYTSTILPCNVFAADPASKHLLDGREHFRHHPPVWVRSMKQNPPEQQQPMGPSSERSRPSPFHPDLRPNRHLRYSSTVLYKAILVLYLGRKFPM